MFDNTAGDPEFRKLLDDAWQLHCTKREDYADSLESVRELGMFPFDGIMVVLSYKWRRLTNLFKKRKHGGAPRHESIRDTLIDTAAYCYLAIIELDKSEAKAKYGTDPDDA